MATTAPHVRKLDVRPSTASSPSKAWTRRLLSAGLIIGDLFLLNVATFAAETLRNYEFAQYSSQIVAGLLAPIFLLSTFAVRAYSADVLLDRGRAVSRVLAALAMTVAAVSLCLFALKMGTAMPRLTVAMIFALSAVLMILFRLSLAPIAARHLGDSVFSVIELNDGPAPLAGPGSLDISRFFDPIHPNPLSLSTLARALDGVDRVVLHCAQERRGAWTQVLKGLETRSEIVAPEMGVGDPVGLGSYGGQRTIIVGQGPLNLHDAAVKRLFDLVIAIAAIVTLAPVFIAVAVIIKLESPGPVFFQQPRTGLRNRLFVVLKFRTMRTASCDVSGSMSTSRGDPRITSFGGFLRRSSLDELPQLFNVLKGEMSIVGPRPHAINSTAEDCMFWHLDDRYWLRHACRPGMTGLAQVQGFRGATEYRGDLTARVEADLAYLRNRSLMSDLLIVLKTVRVLFGDKAY